jgi:hypothetical protein
MLVYHPAYDSYHCITRILKIMQSLDIKEYNIDRIRIYDYYILFLNDINNITLPTAFFEYKKIEKSNRFNKVHNSIYVFTQLENVQNIALRAMASYGFIDKDLFDKDIIKLCLTELPKEINNSLNSKEDKYIDFLKSFFEKQTLREVKKRTKLMEYRYELS